MTGKQWAAWADTLRPLVARYRNHLQEMTTMTVRDVLKAWEFELKPRPSDVADCGDRGEGWEHQSGLRVVLGEYNGLVSVFGETTADPVFFKGCERVEDLRRLLHLLDNDLFLPGDKDYSGRATDAHKIRWHHADQLELKIDGRDSFEPGRDVAGS